MARPDPLPTRNMTNANRPDKRNPARARWAGLPRIRPQTRLWVPSQSGDLPVCLQPQNHTAPVCVALDPAG